MRLLVILVTLCISLGMQAQVRADSLDLRKRLGNYIEFSRAKEFEKLLDYVHPSLFELAPRETVLASMNETFSGKEITFDIDSLSIITISSEFLHAKTKYRRVDLFMAFALRYTDEERLKDTIAIARALRGLKEDFGKDVYFDRKRKAYIVKTPEILLAIKDPGEEWFFLKYGDMLFPNEVRKHFKLD